VKADVPSIEKLFFDTFRPDAHEVVKKPFSVRVSVKIIDYKRCGLQIRRNAEKGLYRAEVIRDQFIRKFLEAQ